MAVFKDDQEVYRYVGGIFETALADPEIGPKLKDSGLSLLFEYTDPTSAVFVDLVDGTVTTGDQAVSAQAILRVSMAADDAHSFWLGQLNLAIAVARKRVRVTGPMPEMLKLLPLAKPLCAQYRVVLEREGRSDLLS